MTKLALLIDSIFKWPAMGLIILYRYTFSAFMGRGCRYEPSCSLFTLKAMRAFGFWRGGWMGLARLVRCRPGCAHGYDPVPEKLPDGATWYNPWRYGTWH